MRSTIAVLLCASLAAASVPAVAGARDTGSRQDATLRLTKKRPGMPSGVVFKVDYVNPSDPQGKPPAVRQVDLTLASGSRYDTSVPDLCTAPDPALMLLGTSACPSGSRVGTGHLTLDTGAPAPARFIDVEIDFFNNTDELIYLTQPGPLDIPRVVIRAEVGERSLMTSAPALPGTPPDGAAVDTVFVRDDVITRRVDGQVRSYITTPPRCPASGYWINESRFGYHDGVSQVVRTKQRCKPGRAAKRGGSR